MPTDIEWTDETWNPITGCTPTSPGCDHCYARRMANRLAGRYGYPSDEPFRPGTFHPDKLSQPLKWRKPRRVFVCSMGDLFHEDVPDETIAAVFGVMAACSQHTFMVLTKRPRRIRRWFKWLGQDRPLPRPVVATDVQRELLACMWLGFTKAGTPAANGWPTLERAAAMTTWPLPNAWLGVTAENQRMADSRIKTLLQTSAAVRFVSVEPMLLDVDLTELANNSLRGDALSKRYGPAAGPRPLRRPMDVGLDWVICGGETGPGARPMDIAWARSLRDQCSEAGVPFFFKKAGGGRETPPDLAIREWPEVTHG